MGFGRDWYRANGGSWFVREHHVTYYRPATFRTAARFERGAPAGAPLAGHQPSDDGSAVEDDQPAAPAASLASPARYVASCGVVNGRAK